MSDQVQEILDVPREFLKDGIQFINKSQKRKPADRSALRTQNANSLLADRREFIKISQAVGVGFLSGFPPKRCTLSELTLRQSWAPSVTLSS
jgi:preprotein translocase subunit Sss1